jgi:hypothetical protein
MIVWILLAVIVLLFFYDSREHMTNEDLISTLKTFGEKGTKPKKSSQTKPVEQPIYGPKAPKLLHPTPPAPSGSNGGSGVYPDIYGPEYEGVPGASPSKSGKHISDGDKSDEAYQFNPNFQKAFPSSGEPQPFLTDFSMFQK